MRTAAALALCLSVPALAQHAVNTFQTGSTAPHGYNALYAWFLGDVSGSLRDEMGFLFTAEAGGGVTSARTSVFSASSAPSTLRFSLYADAGSRPGALLGSWTLQPQFFSGAPNLVPATTPLDAGIVLDAGSRYWLTCAGVGTTPRSWRWYAAGDPGTAPDRPNAYKPSGSTQWQITNMPGFSSGAFALTVPAPGTTPLAGLLLVISPRRRRR